MGLIAPVLISGLVIAAASGCSRVYDSEAALNNNDAPLVKYLKTPYSFAVLGDSRTGTKTYAVIVERVADAEPDFVVNTGDVIEKPGDERDWAGFVRLSAPIEMPYYIVPGNHDIADEKSQAVFRKYVDQPGNELYYSFTAGGSLFVVLDSEVPGSEGRIEGRQLLWLNGLLRSYDAPFTFVFVHRPLYPDERLGRHAGDSLNVHAAKRDELQRLFEETGVDAVFCGHEHMYMRKEVGGVTHVITGGAGAPLYADREDGGFHHFIKVTVEENSAMVRVVDVDGKVMDEFEIKRDGTI